MCSLASLLRYVYVVQVVSGPTMRCAKPQELELDAAIFLLLADVPADRRRDHTSERTMILFACLPALLKGIWGSVPRP